MEAKGIGAYSKRSLGAKHYLAQLSRGRRAISERTNLAKKLSANTIDRRAVVVKERWRRRVLANYLAA